MNYETIEDYILKIESNIIVNNMYKKDIIYVKTQLSQIYKYGGIGWFERLSTVTLSLHKPYHFNKKMNFLLNISSF